VNGSPGPVVGRRVRVAVVGSLNHDLTVWVPHRPGPDETLHGDRVEEFRGGKGANQAVAAARIGAEVAMIGCLGNDARAAFLREGLIADGIDHSHVTTVSSPTGVAVITVDPIDVSIVVVAGANGELGTSAVESASTVIESADVLLLQGESPAPAALAAARIASAAGTLVVFNPAPFNEVAAAVAPLADVLMVNRHEAALLAEGVGQIDSPVLVTTLGAQGCVVEAEGLRTEVPSLAADVVDPTGAGDCFAAAFAVRYAETHDAVESAQFAVAAGSLAVETSGAQPSLPTRAAVEERRSASAD
jgi:ribokinase